MKKFLIAIVLFIIGVGCSTEFDHFYQRGQCIGKIAFHNGETWDDNGPFMEKHIIVEVGNSNYRTHFISEIWAYQIKEETLSFKEASPDRDGFYVYRPIVCPQILVDTIGNTYENFWDGFNRNPYEGFKKAYNK